MRIFGLFKNLNHRYQNYRQAEFRSAQISERYFLAIIGILDIAGIILALLVARSTTALEPWPYFKVGLGITLIIFGYILTLPHNSYVSAIGHFTVFAGYGLAVASAEANEFMDLSIMPMVEMIGLAMLIIWLISASFPSFLKSLLAIPAIFVLSVILFTATRVPIIQAFVGIWISMGLVWYWQSLLKGPLTIDSAIDGATHTSIQVLNMIYRRTISVKYKESGTQIVERGNILSALKGDINIQITYHNGITENLGPLKWAILDLKGQSKPSQDETYANVKELTANDGRVRITIGNLPDTIQIIQKQK